VSLRGVWLIAAFLVTTSFFLFAQAPGFKGEFGSVLKWQCGSSGPIAVTLGDFNGDSKLDAAVVDGTGGNVCLGNGDGSFQAAKPFAAGSSPIALAAADFNKDGKVDLAVVNSNQPGLTNGDTVSILLGNGDGTFQPPVNFATGKNPNAIFVADINGDGNLDIVVSNASSNSLTVLAGKGDGTFTAEPSPSLPFSPKSIQSGEFNGDGKLDIAVAGCTPMGCDFTSTANNLAILLGNGDSTFNQPLLSALSGQVAGHIAAADFNKGGKLDLVVSYFATNVSAPEGTDVDVLLGNGDGSFSKDQTLRLSLTKSVSALAAADFNGDGNPDIIGANQGALMELQALGDGTFTAILYAHGTTGDSMAVGDLNGDGLPDLVYATGATLNVLLNARALSRASSSVSLSITPSPIQALSSATLTAKVNSPATNLTGGVTFLVDNRIVLPSDTLVA